MSLDLFVFPSNIHNFEMHYNFTHLQFIEIDYNIFPTLEVSLTQQNQKQTIVTDCMCRCHNQFNNLTSPTSDFPIDPSTHTTWSPFCHQIMEPSLHKVEIQERCWKIANMNVLFRNTSVQLNSSTCLWYIQTRLKQIKCNAGKLFARYKGMQANFLLHVYHLLDLSQHDLYFIQITHVKNTNRGSTKFKPMSIQKSCCVFYQDLYYVMVTLKSLDSIVLVFCKQNECHLLYEAEQRSIQISKFLVVEF